MLNKIKGIEKRYKELSQLLAEVGDDYKNSIKYAKEQAEMEPIISKAREYEKALSGIEEMRGLLDSDDEDLVDMATSELAELEASILVIEEEMKKLLLPQDVRDKRNVIVEIRAGAGGDEAALFAADLYRMYSRFAENRKWKIEILSQNEIGIGGIKEISFLIKGRGAYSKLKYESGVHRVQRVPKTESQGRIHTSTITVAVLAEVDDIEIDIPDGDIRMDVYKSAGAGGQSVQKNSTAVRLTHLPSGITVQCQDERSQLQNRLRAMSIMRARLFEIEEEKQRSEIEQDRRSQVGKGDRSEKIRTYNYPQSRVTDHRINVSSYNLQGVLDGGLDLFIDELITQDEISKLAEAGL